MKTIKELCDEVRKTAYAIHVYHGHGYFKKYIMSHERRQGIQPRKLSGFLSCLFAFFAFLCGK